MFTRMHYRKLGRQSSHRLALLENLTRSLIRYEQVKTTLSKAKELRPFIEKFITIGKKGGLKNLRLAYSMLGSNELTRKFIQDIVARYKDRKGGYTRIVRSGFRKGDGAPEAFIELVEKQVLPQKLS